MATGPKIVHKQFNSPIGLYSQNNIQETLNKHLQNLDNGTVGIDFNNPATGKPGNLANSAVLRMLEEEERNRKGYPKLDPTQVQAILETMVHMNHRFDSCWPPEKAKDHSARCWDGQLNSTGQIHSEFLKATKGKKKVVWPPLPETNGYHSPQQLSPAYAPAQQYEAPQQQYQPYQQNQAPQQQSYPKSQPQPQYSTLSQPQHQYAPQSYQTPKSPAFCEGKRQEATGLSKLIPVGPGVTAAPVSPPRRVAPAPTPAPLSPQPYKQQSNRWAPVAAPLSPQGYGSQPTYPASAPQYSAPYDYSQKPVEPPATIITLRPSPPVHQQPPPVFASQPATATYQGGVNMRGDMKWPPQSVKEAVAAENEARRQLAKGPACRPRKVKKDYSSFFAQHALGHNYPGYRAPPGTQHYEEHPGRSSY